MRLLTFLILIFFYKYTFAIYFNKISVSDGLINNSVLSIAQDSLGRIWFGTEQGISIYDGNRIISYDENEMDNHSTYNNSSIKNIITDFKGNVYFISSPGLIKYDINNQTFKTICAKKINALHYHNGIIYFASNNKLFKWDNYNNTEVFIENIPTNATGMIIDNNNNKWFISEEGLFFSEEGYKTKKISDYPFYSIYKSKSNEIWAGSKMNGLFRIKSPNDITTYNTQNSSSKGLFNNNIRKITEDEYGYIWFGTFNGLYKYHPKKDKFSSYIRENNQGALSNSSVYSVFIDNNNTLWVGTYFGGANYSDLYQEDFIHITASDSKNSLSHPVVGDMTEDDNGNIWICTEGGGLNMYNKNDKSVKQFTSNKYPYYMPHTNLKSITYNHNNKLLYIGTQFNSLYTYDIEKNKFYHISYDAKNKDLNIINVIKNRGDSLYLSTNFGVYLYLLKNNQFIKFHKQQLKKFTHISIVNSNELWVIDDGLYIYDIESLKVKKHYRDEEMNLPQKKFRLKQTKNGDIYIGTNGHGIMKLNKEKRIFEHFPPSQSRVLNKYCYRIEETQKGNLITVGNEGIIIFDKKGKILQFLKVGSSIPISSFTKNCGILIAKDSTIYVGGSNGLISFKEKKGTEINNSDLYFSELYINNNLIRPNQNNILKSALYNIKKIYIPASNKKIEILFSSKNNITQFNQFSYEYRLKGIDDMWNTSVGNSIIYTNLPTGKYTLELRNKSDISDIKKLHIQILPPWYFTWWAWCLWLTIALAVALFVISNIKNRLKAKALINAERMEKEKIKEINEAKLKFFTSVSHEFKTPLTLIIGLMEQIINTNDLPSSVYKKMLKVIHQSEHLNKLITELIEFRKFEQGKMILDVSPVNANTFFTDIYENFKMISKQKNLDFKINKTSAYVNIYIDQLQMGKVVNNLLSNAFNYTPENGKISIDMDIDTANSLFIFKISDTGIGMTKEDLPYIFKRFYQAENNLHKNDSKYSSGIGLALVKNIVEAHKGIIEVESEPNNGTTFTVKLKLGYEHFINDKNVKLSHSSNILSVTNDDAKKQEYFDTELATSTDTCNSILTDNSVKPAILFVEDNPDLLEVLKERFSELYEVYTAQDGIEGLEKTKEIKPDIVVSDIMMPRMTGIELCDSIKKDLELCHIPVILLTALNMPEQNLEGLLHGADDYIGKPFHTQILLARCNNMIRSRRLIYQKLSKQMDEDISLVATNKTDKTFLDKVTAIVETNLVNPEFSIDNIAEEMCMSRASFYNKFKELTKVTPNDYINTYRLKKATQLLMANDEISITEISDMLGFSSPNYFCRKFKECFNMTPTQYKKHRSSASQDTCQTKNFTFKSKR